jgi:4-hydroxy-3-methylbut-2-en-1-yl diphosphate synthase IspG/GcpE
MSVSLGLMITKEKTMSDKAMPETTGRIRYAVYVNCPACGWSLNLADNPYDDETSEYSRGEDDLGLAVFGGTTTPAKWDGLDLEYICWSCQKPFLLSGVEV